jgi:hypothetical protein
MIKSTTLSNIVPQQDCVQPKQVNETRIEKTNEIKNISSVSNSPMEFSKNRNLVEKSANTIKNFLKKAIAAQSYSNMFSKGAYFKELGIEMAEPKNIKSSFNSLQHLDKISNTYLSKIKQKTKYLTPDEKNLLSKIIDTKLHFRHQSNSNLSNIMSLDKLQRDGIATAKNTYSEDVRCLSNQDFVFFGVEFSDDKSKLPLNSKHTTVDFGAIAYITDDQNPYGYLTLTDHFDNKVPPAFTHEHKDFISQFSQVRNEIERYVHGENGRHDIPIYNAKDLKVALGLHLIDFLRNSTDNKFKEFVLNKNLGNKDLDRVLNFVFQPEFHVPRMVSTADFKKVQLREIRLDEAVSASNIEELSAHIKNKDDACKAMGIAIIKSKTDIVEYLLSKFNFSKEDTHKMSSYEDIEYTLSDYSSDSRILKIFLDLKLVEPNKKFIKVNSGDTMLDNAIKYSKKEMISILLEHGAVCGKELRKNESKMKEVNILNNKTK